MNAAGFHESLDLEQWVSRVSKPQVVLVTGAGGFLGRHVARLHVERGDRVRSFSRSHYDFLDAWGVEQVQGDLRDARALEKACQSVDVVHHVASLAGIWGRWRDYHSINVKGTQHVLDACRAGGVSRLVYTSSPSVTFDGEDQCGLSESVPYARRFLCHYPRSKAMAERRVLESSDPALATCALRPHLIWGPHDNHLLPRLLARARRGKLRRIGDGTNVIDTVYVENAADAHVLAADRLEPGGGLAGQAYWITQHEPVNCWDWIDRLLACGGLPAVEKTVSAGLAIRVGGFLELLYRCLPIAGEPPMTRFLARQLSTSHFFNSDRAKRDLGYEPRVSNEEGLRRLKAHLGCG